MIYYMQGFASCTRGTHSDLLFQELHIGSPLHEHFGRERPEEVGCTNLVSVYQAIVHKLLVHILHSVATADEQSDEMQAALVDTRAPFAWRLCKAADQCFYCFRHHCNITALRCKALKNSDIAA
eukprot:17636-Heterococcus_DN1.PRE.1